VHREEGIAQRVERIGQSTKICSAGLKALQGKLISNSLAGLKALRYRFESTSS